MPIAKSPKSNLRANEEAAPTLSSKKKSAARSLLAAAERRGPFAERSAGILVHPTSLPGPFGAGDLASARRFVRYLADAGQTFWQMLPVGPIGRGNSPYDSESSFAGAPILVSLERLAERGWLSPADLQPTRGLTDRRVAFDAVRAFREPRLRKAFAQFESSPRERRALDAFLEERPWAQDWSLYRALRVTTGQHWTDWDAPLRQRKAAALERVGRELRDEIRYHAFLQWAFESQWTELREECRARNVRLLGDVPMFVAHDSAEVWANPELFFLDERGRTTVVAGVPPDVFSRTGQLWGNPLYRWEAMGKGGYAWWIERLRSVLCRFDAVRLDHFIAFHRYWEVPGRAKTAMKGRFVLAPGREFFSAARAAFGGLPFVAEDLGLLTPEVEALRDEFGLPGMKVFQFAFDDDKTGRVYLPHRYTPNTVAYTGTHDNDTTVGWFEERAPKDRARNAALDRRRERVRQYLGESKEVHWQAIRALLLSVANTTIFPIQDLLGLDSRSRMNVPGVGTGNWEWRLLPKQLDPRVAERMRSMTEASGRIAASSW
jgi:4-alpha-glucanotransferase